MDNPIKAIRTSLGLSQGDLIRFSGLNRMVVLRTEQGLYSSPSKSLTQPLIDLSGNSMSHDDIVGLYKSSQTFTRQSQNWWVKKLNKGFSEGVPPVAEPFKVHPFIEFRQSKNVPTMFHSRMGFCKAFCLHPNSMRLFEMSVQIIPPESLIVGLKDAGMSAEGLAWVRDSALLWAQQQANGR